jgi:hypothetical protein
VVSSRFTLGKRAPGTHWIGGWVGSRAGLKDVKIRNIPTWTRNPDPSVQLRASCYTDWALPFSERRCNALDEYFGGVRFDSLQGHRLSWQDFSGFPPSLQANARTMPGLSHDHFSPNPFKFIMQLSFFHSTLYNPASYIGGPGSSPGQVMCGLLLTKWHWGKFSPSTSVSPANSHSIDCSTLTYHPGLVQ